MNDEDETDMFKIIIKHMGAMIILNIKGSIRQLKNNKNKRMKKILMILFCTGIMLYLIPGNLRSDDLKKANTYYEKYDYHYAIQIYEKLLHKKPTLEVAQKLANCYRFTNNTLAAEKAYAKVLTFAGFDPVNYLYYADALKQNAKFDMARLLYLTYAERVPAKSDEAVKLANSCNTARLWYENPDPNIQVTNEVGLNSENSDCSPIVDDQGFIFVSDRVFLSSSANSNSLNQIYGWTGNPYTKLYQATRVDDHSDGNLKLSLLPEQVNRQFPSGPASWSPDGETLFFTTSGVVDKKNKKSAARMNKSIYYAVRQNGVWSQAISFPYNDPLHYTVQHPAISPDGNILYFAADMPGTLGGMDLFYSEKTSNGWSTPVNCGPAINTSYDEVYPYISGDNELFFSSKGHLGMGGLDIFSATGAKNNWTTPENLKAPMNSPKDDFGVFYFPNHLAGMLSSNRPGGKGADDIYLFNEKPKEPFFAVQGEVVRKSSAVPLEGVKIILLNKKTHQEASVLSAADGSFKFELEKETDYLVSGDVDKYINRQQGEISTKGATESTVYHVRFEVEKGEDAYLVRLNNIYYDFDRYNIRKDAEPELMKVVHFMSLSPNVDVELRSHTDARGPAAYNRKLSEKRAKAAENFLVHKGADESRLSAKGFGETQLLNRCADGVKCTAAEQQLNRRTEFKVVKVTPVMSYVPGFYVKPSNPYRLLSEIK